MLRTSEDFHTKLSEKGWSGIGAATLACMRRMRKPYLTDLSDAEWACLKGHVPSPEHDGLPRGHSLREILNAVFYIVKSGCAWRLLPHDLERPG